jgi:multimeric flavodoxin WrbA
VLLPFIFSSGFIYSEQSHHLCQEKMVKVILINGSPHAEGCTYTALKEVAAVLSKEGVETEIFQVGKKPIIGCTACLKCTDLGHCVFDDRVNEFIKIAGKYDGYIFGTPVHYAAAGGAITSFMDRVFYAISKSKKDYFYLKPAAAVISARRAGTTATFDQMNKYFTISQMPVISSRYWNMVHGNNPDEVRQDLEGLQTMRILGRNMAFFLKCKEAGLTAGVNFPVKEETTTTNFIR